MFIDLSAAIAHNPPARHYGVAVTDIDGDGRPEFVVAGFGGPNRVLKWANGQLLDVAPPDLADPAMQAIGLAAADIDCDGQEELYILNTDTYSGPKRQADRLFDRTPDGRWLDLFDHPANRPARNPSAGRSVAALDRRGTGRYGFAVANYGRPLRLYELTPDGVLADVAAAAGLNLSANGRGLLVAPLTSDRPDLFCTAEAGRNLLFRNTGVGTFAEVAEVYGLGDGNEHGRGAAALDADADGRLDVAYGNWDGPHRLMVRKPDGTFRNRATPAMALPSTVRTVIAADFDNCGEEELFFNNIGESNRLFRQPRPGEWALADPGEAAEPDLFGTGAAVADVDGDGVLELLVAHGESAAQPLTLYKCGRPADGVLRVRPLTRFGGPARGAVVRLTTGDRTRLRVIDGGSGYLCQMEPTAHFGLGPAGSADALSVTWPDGEQVTIDQPEVGGVTTVAYPGS